jgi:hypothetical protein
MRTNETKSAKNGTAPAAKRAPRAAAPAKPRPPAVKPAAAPVMADPTDEQIRVRAYEIYLRRGGAPGDQFGDWLLAKSELIAEMAVVAPPAAGRKRTTVPKQS